MVNKAKATPELLDAWKTRLAEATASVHETRAGSVLAEEQWRETIRNAFAAGLAAPRIAEYTGLTVSRVYQIKRGVRH